MFANFVFTFMILYLYGGVVSFVCGVSKTVKVRIEELANKVLSIRAFVNTIGHPVKILFSKIVPLTDLVSVLLT